MLNDAAAPLPANLQRLPLFDDHRHSPVAAGQIEQVLARFRVGVDVELYKIDSAPFEIFSRRRAKLAAP